MSNVKYVQSPTSPISNIFNNQHIEKKIFPRPMSNMSNVQYVKCPICQMSNISNVQYVKCPIFPKSNIYNSQYVQRPISTICSVGLQSIMANMSSRSIMSEMFIMSNEQNICNMSNIQYVRCSICPMSNMFNVQCPRESSTGMQECDRGKF